MIIAKFGGTSVATLQNAKRIKNIIKGDKNYRFVVVSALGKNNLYEQKVTDMLFKVYYLYSCGQDYIQLVDQIFYRYKQLAEQMNVKVDFGYAYNQLLNRLNDKTATKEYVVSRGEYLSALLYSKYLKGEFLDAADYIIFGNNSQVNFAQTAKQFKRLNKEKLYIIGGFYGATKTGEEKVFARGGSDITGAVIAKVLNAEIYHNFTDVDGVFDKNPRVFCGAKSLPILSYKTAYGMADAGNEIVHKTALKLLKNTQTVLMVKNTQTDEYGTVVTRADYILENLFVCKTNIKVLIFNDLSERIKKKLFLYAEVKQIIKHDELFFVLIDQIYVEQKHIDCLAGLALKVDAIKFAFFSNIKIDNKNIKKLQKIQKKLKKRVIFGKFLSYKNNFIILAKSQDEAYVTAVVNKYLQT